jgi:hypothetical protein
MRGYTMINVNEFDVREELAEIVSRFGAEVSPSEVPDEIVANYRYGLSTGRWYLKTPQPKDQRLVLHAIAGINCAIEAQSDQELDEAGRVLLIGVMEAMSSHNSQALFLHNLVREMQAQALHLFH